ncbi:MAG: mechanosensitive ion channel [Alphaproteobacteria bacterium]|nr:mechanosensitive ion channel [Alphaproteobacteria bacterium]
MIRRAAWLYLLSWLVPVAALAQSDAAALVAAWARQVDMAAIAIESPQSDNVELIAIRQQLADLRAEARALRRANQAEAANLKRLMEAVGPAPDDKAPQEAAEITARRKSFESQSKAIEGVLHQAGILVTLVDYLIERLDQRRARLLVQALLHPDAYVFSPGDWAAATRAWIEAAAKRADRSHDGKVKPLGWLAAWVALGLVALRVLPVAETQGGTPPLYRRRVLGAVRDALTHGAILAPGLWLLARLMALALSPSQLIADLMEGVALGVGLTLATLALAQAVLRLDRPEWRLLPLGNGAARRLHRHVAHVAVLIGVLAGTWVGFPESARLAIIGQTYGAAFTVIAGVAMLWLLPENLWKPGLAAASGLPRFRPMSEREIRLWRLARRAFGAVILFSIAAIIVGYGLLGAFVLRNLMVAALIGGALMLLRTMAREVVLSGIEWIETAQGQRVLAELPTLPGWIILAVVDLIMVLTGVFLLLPTLGLEWGQVVDLAEQLWRGFAVGSVRIAPGDMVMAALAAGFALAVTRWTQRVMDRRLADNATVDIGVRTALRTGVGYLGIGLAIAAVIGLIGFDLTNFALIAGALSVGIGFGMQNLFNNFASGLILLIERPIKVGDWVEVGGQEGVVKRIDVRSTEIVTERASAVIVPNSEILQTAVVNWTHGDRHARVDIRIAVAGTANLEDIERLMVGCAAADARVAEEPKPHVLLQEIGDDLLEFELRAFVKKVEERLFVASDLRKAVLKALADAGIERRHASAIPILRAASRAPAKRSEASPLQG